MSTHSVADAKTHLSELINRALEGEGVVITRRGQPVVELRPIESAIDRVDEAPRRITEADVEWLRARRVGRLSPDKDAAELVREMRDEGEA